MVTPMICEGGCASGDKGVGALIQERALVFLDVAFLDGIDNILLSLLPEMGLDPFLSANLLM